MNIKKIILDPGVLFAVANVFAFLQSGSVPALGLALVTALVTIGFSCAVACGNKTIENSWLSPLRLSAYGVLGAGVFSFAHGAVLPGIAGLGFASFSFLASSETVQRLQNDPRSKSWLKALTHPAVYCGVGYAMIGLMAGGGMVLLAHPFANIPALVTTCLGVTVTSLSTVGLISGGFRNPAAPFMAVVLGTFINMLSGLISGNILGTANNFFAMCGELRFAWDAQTLYEARENKAPARGSFLSVVSGVLIAPLRIVRRILL